MCRNDDQISLLSAFTFFQRENEPIDMVLLISLSTTSQVILVLFLRMTLPNFMPLGSYKPSIKKSIAGLDRGIGVIGAAPHFREVSYQTAAIGDVIDG
jgi:hypothetical protein